MTLIVYKGGYFLNTLRYLRVFFTVLLAILIVFLFYFTYKYLSGESLLYDETFISLIAGAIGGIGTILAALVTIENIKEDRIYNKKIRDEDLKGEFANKLKMLTSLYITDISGYYYAHYFKYRKNTFDSKDIKIDRTIAVRAYYDIKFLLYNKSNIENIIDNLECIHRLDPLEITEQEFSKLIKDLQDNINDYCK